MKVQKSKGQEDLYFMAVHKVHGIFNVIGQFVWANTQIAFLWTAIFCRKNFGQRSLSFTAVLWAYFWAIVVYAIGQETLPLGENITEPFSYIFNGVWLIYIHLFLAVSIWHRRKISKYNSTVSFEKFSLYTGDSWRFWTKREGHLFLGIKVTQFTIPVYLEPLPFIVIGIILMLFPVSRGTGAFIILRALLYGFRNFASAMKAKNFLMDKIDKRIIATGWQDALVEEKPANQNKGFSIPLSLPYSKEERETLAKITDQREQELPVWQNDDLDLAG